MLGIDVRHVPVMRNQVGDLPGKQYRYCLVSAKPHCGGLGRIQCVNSSSFPSPKRPATGPTRTPSKHRDSEQLRRISPSSSHRKSVASFEFECKFVSETTAKGRCSARTTRLLRSSQISLPGPGQRMSL